MGIEHQEAEKLAAQLEAAAKSVRAAMTPPQRGVFMIRGQMGYSVMVDGFDLGIDTSWSDANALCQVIATRRPPGDEMGYGIGFHTGTPFGISSRDTENSTVTIGISVQEQGSGVETGLPPGTGCSHPKDRRGMRGGLRRGQTVCMICGAVIPR